MTSRGVEVVDQIIAAVKAGEGSEKIAAPKGVPESELVDLTFGDGKPLPPSLLRWLAFDRTWLEKELGVSNILKTLQEGDTLADVVGDGVPEEGEEAFEELVERMPGAAVPLDRGSDSARALYAGKRDEDGECAVVSVSWGDVPGIEIIYPGFDAWLAVQLGIEPEGEQAARWPDALFEHGDNLLGGELQMEYEGSWA